MIYRKEHIMKLNHKRVLLVGMALFLISASSPFYIFFGTIVAVISFMGITFVDNYQLARVIEKGIP